MEEEDWQHWDVDVWYPLLSPSTTFPTLFLPLDAHQMQALCAGSASPSTSPTLQTLCLRIGDLIAQLGGRAFVRLSSLSPKDAVKRDARRLSALLANELQTRAVKGGDYVHELLAVNTAQYRACLVTSGMEAMALLLASDRVQQHLRNRLEESPGHPPRISIVVRQWADIHPEFEFRGFVSGGRLVALSHYYQFLFTPRIVVHAERFLNAVALFHKEHISLPSLDRYVCDFYVDPDTFQVKCIELNPWAPNTSPALYEWKDLNERDILEGSDPVFRFLPAPIPDAVTRISSFWRALLEVARGLESEHCVAEKRLSTASQAKYCLKLAKKECTLKKISCPWADGVVPLLQVIASRGFVTESDVMCFGLRGVISSAGLDFQMPSVIFMLWGSSISKRDPRVHKKLLEDSLWQCALYLSGTPSEEITNSFHNIAVWLKKETVL